MEKHLQEYARWQAQHLPEELAAELAAIRGDESEIYDRFCRTMHFGTSGLRGRMGVGTNRINAILLGKATRAISRYLTARYEAPAMVIGYDTRHNSREYAVGIAKVFAPVRRQQLPLCRTDPGAGRFVCSAASAAERRHYDHRQP